ncbi:MAG: 1-deoxy-D-xylulose-5-phosphate reductoisomerase [Marinicellaceae bacterium]
MNESRKNILILGATGSIGDSTLDIISRHPDRFKIFALTGHSNIQKLVKLCEKFKPKYVISSDEKNYTTLKNLLSKLDTKVLSGEDSLLQLCQMNEIDMVVAGIVGSAGMKPVLAALEAGKDLLLANKEALVMAGDLVMQAAKKNKANIIPLDSEHNAIYQCLTDSYKVGDTPQDIEKIILTASGGPFWKKDLNTFNEITPAMACAHPNWDMGRKISVDSATLMNKGLEVIEAHWLFNLSVDKIDVHVHPQSIIHSMVCYIDGSILAQLGEPDMRIPIAYGLGLRQRIKSGASLIDLLVNNELQFLPPDYKKFPCLKLAQDAIKSGGTSMAILNSANESSVEAFLNQQIPFTAIAEINAKIMNQSAVENVENVEQLIELDHKVRIQTHELIKNWSKRSA